MTGNPTRDPLRDPQGSRSSTRSAQLTWNRAGRRHDWDAVIVGGGPAGAAAAARLAREGSGPSRSTGPPFRLPRDKVCGDFAGPAALAGLADAGAAETEGFRATSKILDGALHVGLPFTAGSSPGCNSTPGSRMQPGEQERPSLPGGRRPPSSRRRPPPVGRPLEAARSTHLDDTQGGDRRERGLRHIGPHPVTVAAATSSGRAVDIYSSADTRRSWRADPFYLSQMLFRLKVVAPQQFQT